MKVTPEILFVFTKHFPYGKAEQYLVDELPFLSGKFSKVVFVPAENFNSENAGQRELPANCEVLHLNQEAEKKRTSKKWLEFLIVFFTEWLRCRNKAWFWKERYRYKSVLLHQAHLASVMEGIIPQRYNGKAVFYTYWIHNSAIMLGLMKRRGAINGFISRGHSIDLYEWDWVLTRYIKILPFYHFIIQQATYIAAISQHGADYLQKRFPQFAEKLFCSRLGVKEFGINPFHSEEKFTIVSCSNFSDNKRISEIASVISKIEKIPVRWIHFGDGPGKEKIEKAIQHFPSHISVELRGFTPNEEIKAFYASETVNLVINMSEAEGIPVSLMEAISFGIPVLATDVYGNPEIANNETGFCVPFHSATEQVAAMITAFASDNNQQLKTRESARNFYFKKFNANANYKEFVSRLPNAL